MNLKPTALSSISINFEWESRVWNENESFELLKSKMFGNAASVNVSHFVGCCLWCFSVLCTIYRETGNRFQIMIYLWCSQILKYIYRVAASMYHIQCMQTFRKLNAFKMHILVNYEEPCRKREHSLFLFFFSLVAKCFSIDRDYTHSVAMYNVQLYSPHIKCNIYFRLNDDFREFSWNIFRN